MLDFENLESKIASGPCTDDSDAQRKVYISPCLKISVGLQFFFKVKLSRQSEFFLVRGDLYRTQLEV